MINMVQGMYIIFNNKFQQKSGTVAVINLPPSLGSLAQFWFYKVHIITGEIIVHYQEIQVF